MSDSFTPSEIAAIKKLFAWLDKDKHSSLSDWFRDQQAAAIRNLKSGA